MKNLFNKISTNWPIVLIEATSARRLKHDSVHSCGFNSSQFGWFCGVILVDFFVIKPTRWTNITNLFCHETLHVSDSSSVHNQEFIHCTLRNDMSYRFVDSFRAGPSLVLLENCLQTCITYTIAECPVNKLLVIDRRTVRNM
jgi:hypothetical protein